MLMSGVYVLPLVPRALSILSYNTLLFIREVIITFCIFFTSSFHFPSLAYSSENLCCNFWKQQIRLPGEEKKEANINCDTTVSLSRS